jgi:hypothetical protein
MATDEIIIRLFCLVDGQLGHVNKRSDAHVYTSEFVTIGLLFSRQGGRFRACYRWLHANDRGWFPTLPERTRLQRLLCDYAALALEFLADPPFFTVVDTYGIALIHPRREGRGKRQIGKKGKLHGRGIVGVKLAWRINDQGEVVDWTWDTVNEPDKVFRPLAIGYDGATIRLADRGLRAKEAPPSNIHWCARGPWNERFTIETNLSWVTELFHAKKLYQRVKSHLEARLWYLAARINCLLRLTERKRSLADFVI